MMSSISHLYIPSPDTKSNLQPMLEAVAVARGCRTSEQISDFLAALPKLVNPLLEMRDLNKAAERVVKAIGANETITIFGDYDCDGVTSSAQCINLLRAANHKNFRAYIPDRFAEDYGLTMDAVTRCVQEHKPTLIISVDCGSSSNESLLHLREIGIDVIVLDHHQIQLEGEHPAFAHLNPKGDPGFISNHAIQDASRMSAAGLAFFFCDYVSRLGGYNWDREANLILCGLGTYVDVMPMIGVNRALVKHALALANSEAIYRVPGLVALLDANSFKKKITEHTLGFVLGPCFNASGRLAHARASLNLACAITPKSAAERAVVLVEKNNERKSIQEKILKEALQQADAIMAAAPDTKILILYARDWHTGIVGIVAGRVKEKFHRPTIVMARLENGFWKGSGRSVRTIDIGAFVAEAVKQKVIVGGGGHSMACGVKLTDDQLSNFICWVKEHAILLSNDLSPEYEVIGEIDWMSADEWCRFYELAAPFGQGNPRPLILAESMQHNWGPEPAYLSDKMTVWGIKAGFSSKAHPSITVCHTELAQGMDLLAPDTATRMVLDFTRTVVKAGRTYDNWKMVHGEKLYDQQTKVA